MRDSETQGQAEEWAASGPQQRWSAPRWSGVILLFTLLMLLVNGYHPLAEDGGLYVAGVQYKLDPTLFPHYTEFVQEHLRFSGFAPCVAGLVHMTRLPLAWVLLALYIGSLALNLFAAWAVLRRCVQRESARMAGMALFAAWSTLPVAGTSLLLLDPYLTARSFSTPLSLLAVAFAMDRWSLRGWSVWGCASCLVAAGAMHPLMAAYALVVVLGLRAARSPRRVVLWGAMFAACVAGAAVLQWLAPVESAALRAAEITRYYWFLSQWQWYERLGLVGPVVILLLLLRYRRARMTGAAAALCRVSVLVGVGAVVLAILFAREDLARHMLARLQPLRVFLLLYALMAMLLGATLGDVARDASARLRGGMARRLVLLAPFGFMAAMFVVMFFVQRQTFRASPQVEWPWTAESRQNGWVQAFLWARRNTAADALFAMDARYVNTDGEDAQTFRAIALRSSLPDYSKDGGEAAIYPPLAEEWRQGADAQAGLSDESDAERDARLLPLGVTWMVLHTSARTGHECPYANAVVKVCKLAGR